MSQSCKCVHSTNLVFLCPVAGKIVVMTGAGISTGDDS